MSCNFPFLQKPLGNCNWVIAKSNGHKISKDLLYLGYFRHFIFAEFWVHYA